MQRLINANRLKAYLQDKYVMYDHTLADIDAQPTVDAVPVRHGRWIKDDTGVEYCSNCHEYPYDDGEYHIANWHSNYCPNCGAKMDEVKNDEF